MFGDGSLALTITSDNTKPYQGIVPLEGDNLAAALEGYFTNSEQLNTRLWLFADDNTASGLLLQELPSTLNDSEDWERITLLASTITSHEMLNLDCETLLYRYSMRKKSVYLRVNPLLLNVVVRKPKSKMPCACWVSPSWKAS